jgi:Flp pilus assembly protein TadG
VLPLVVVLLLALIQLGLLVRDQILVVHAAREAARAAAVDPKPGAASAAAADGSGLPSSRLEVDVTGRGGPGSRVAVAVSYKAPTDIPLVGAAVADVTLRGRATMRVEK